MLELRPWVGFGAALMMPLAVACASASVASTPPAAAVPAPPAQPAAQAPQVPQVPAAPAALVGGMAAVLAASTAEDWRVPDPQHLLYLELAAGRVVFELAPEFAPRHVGNVVALVREGYFDGLAIVRVQDNYVVQWADPGGRRPIRTAQRTLPAELDRPLASLPFTALPNPDTYASQVGFSGSFPVARDGSGTAWLVHCYGMLGAGRDTAPESGGGTELYVVIGHSPRQLDRNVTLFGRVLWGIERLSALPRGSGALGFYEKQEEHVPITRMRVAADVPAAERTELEVLRTDTPTFTALVESRRNRREAWFLRAAGQIEVCNVPLVTRLRPPG